MSRHEVQIRICPTCGESFEPTRGRKYCSEGCWPSRRRYAADPGEVPTTRDRAEIVGLLWAAARRGSVEAARILLKEVRTSAEGKAARSVIDELAARRVPTPGGQP